MTQEFTLRSGGVELDASADRFGYLLDSNELLSDFDALRGRMDRDGYLYLPGFFPREGVEKVRRSLCLELDQEGLLDPNSPLDACIARQGVEMDFRPDIANSLPVKPILDSVIYGEKIMDFYSGFLGGPSMHYDFTWLRTVAPGKGAYPHCDVVFMGRGTKNLYTAWIPFGDVPLNVGGLLLLEGSHKDAKVRSTYCDMDVDTACHGRPGESQLNAAGFPGFGALSYDMRETRDEVGGRLLTAKEFKMGDLLTFSVYTIHGSLDNRSREIRLSSDSRYQLASEPVDERWVGEHPPGHGGAMVKGMIC